MQKDNFNYILETQGKDRSQWRDQGGQVTPYVPFQETGFFSNLQEAIYSLLQIDMHQFEEMTEQAAKGLYYETAHIIDLSKAEKVVEIMRIPFSDSPDGSPPAGLYLSFDGNSTEDFEQKTGYVLSHFDDYDPRAPFLLLASYSYDKQFSIAINNELIAWLRDSSQPWRSRPAAEAWNHQVEITRDSTHGPAIQRITRYHYPHLSHAFERFLQTDINDLDKSIATTSGKDSWISKASITNQGIDNIEMVAVKDELSDEQVFEPGIHLKFYWTINGAEKAGRIDLSGLGNYGQDDKYLLIANYNKDCTQLLPHPGYVALMSGIDADRDQQSEEKETAPYRMQVLWENIHPANDKEKEGKTRWEHSESCSSLPEALNMMKELDDRFFDKQHAGRLHSPLYIRQADVIATDTNTVICSKFLVPDAQQQLPAGMYFKVNGDYLSVDLLRLLHMHMKEQTKGESFHFVVAGTARDEPHRKIAGAQRTVNPPGDSGMKL